ncbi:MAG TPA: hypothetical protein VIJ76_06455 [Galbitalea sp.]
MCQKPTGWPESEQAKARGLVHSFRSPDSQGARGEVVPQPVRFSGIIPSAPTRSPRLGERTDEVQAEILHLTAGDISDLRERKAI